VASGSLDAAGLGRLASRVGRLPGVADVRYDRTWLDRLAALTSAVRWVGFFLAGLLILAAALTVTNVVRLALFARRDEVEIMELVGAPLAYIRGPFVCEGILQGGLGAVLALAALRLGLAFARARLGTLAGGVVGPAAIEFLAADASLAILAGGMAVGCIGGLVAARRLR
jgi:cell division transport system permease protein